MNESMDAAASRRVFERMPRDRAGNAVLSRPMTFGELGIALGIAALLGGGLVALFWPALSALRALGDTPFFAVLFLGFCSLFGGCIALHPLFYKVLYTGEALVDVTPLHKRIFPLDGDIQSELDESGAVVLYRNEQSLRLDLGSRGGYELYDRLGKEHGIVFPDRLTERFEIAREQALESEK